MRGKIVPHSRGERAAIYAEEAGWKVFPCHHILANGTCSCGMPCPSPGKHPRVKWKDEKTSEVDKISAWWTTWPDANIGIATGPESGLLVLDVDVTRSVELGDGSLLGEGIHSLRSLEERFGPLPATRVASTGSGGQHFYFTYPAEGDWGNRTGIAPGLDIRAQDGYVIGPGSNHTSGHDYEWLVRVALAEPPGWVLSLSERPDERQDFDPDGSVGEGGRNDYLTRIAGQWRGKHDVDEGELFDILWVKNIKHCDPPLEPDEVMQITRSAMKFKPNKQENEIVFDQGQITPIVPIPEGRDLAWQIGDFLSRDIIPPKPLVEGLFDEGTGIVIAGPSNVGKSWLVLQLALAVATGTPYLGQFAVTEPRSVLLIDEEGHEYGDQQRLKMLINGHNLGSMVEVPLNLTVGRGMKLDNPIDLAAVRRMISRYDAKLVIFDSMVRMHDGDENMSRGMANFLAITQRLKQTTGAAFVFVHHIRKQQAERPDDIGDLMRGSSEIKAFFDTGVIVLPGQDAQHIEFHVNKQRWKQKPAHPFSVRLLTRSDELWATLGYMGELQGEDKSAVGVQNRIMESIQTIITNQSSPDLDTLAAYVGLSQATVKGHLGRMLAQQRVQISQLNKKIIYLPVE